MSQTPTYCMIFEAIGPYNAIGKVAVNGIRVAQEAGYKVTVVAKRLDEELQKEVEWLPMYVPPRLFYLQWVTAERFIKQALGGRKFDIVHAHQPQVAHLSDVFQCHFLTRIADERNCLEVRKGLKPALMRMQEQGVLRAEDRYYSHWNPHTKMLYVSEMIRQQFHRLYGAPPCEEVLANAMPSMNIPTEEERRAARIKLIGHDYSGPVVGYIGGLHERKGYRQLIAGLEGDNEVFLLMGGQFSEGFEAPTLQGRFKSVGLVLDNQTFYAACDVFAVPSYFDPCPLVTFEAAARGLPVIATDGVGNLPNLLEYDCGAAWEFGTPLAPLACELMARRERCREGAKRMSEALSRESWRKNLQRVYNEVLERKAV